MRRIEDVRPDAIAVTGDFLNHRSHCAEQSAAFLSKLQAIAPVYLISGNHEYASREWYLFRREIRTRGATLLENRAVAVHCPGGRTFTMAGVDDFRFFGKSLPPYRAAVASVAWQSSRLPRPVVLLAHRPEHYAIYAEHAFDLILSGHAHGGQVRIPGIGPLFAPNEGIFPKHAQGIHRINGSCLVVSRGLGPSRVPLRIFNRPELVVVDLPL